MIKWFKTIDWMGVALVAALSFVGGLAGGMLVHLLT